MATDQYGNYYYDPSADPQLGQGYIDPNTGQMSGTNYQTLAAPTTTPTDGSTPLPTTPTQSTTTQDAGISAATQPATGAPLTQTTPAGTGQVTDQRSALQYAMSQGLSGQAAIDWVQKNYPQYNVYGSGIQYYPGTNTFGGNGWYAAPGGGQYGFDWINRNMQQEANSMSGAGTAGSYGSASASSIPGSNIPIPQGGLTNTDQYSALYNTLMGRANQSLQVNPNDPIIANQVNAYNANAQRGVNNYINQQAETAGPISNLNEERRQANEQATSSTGQMQAQLMQNELTARRQEIAQALNQMGGLLTSEQQMALQQQLGLLDASIRQNALNLQNSQFMSNLGYQYSALGQQNQQFLDTFGFNSSDRAAYWDAVRRGLI